MEFKYELIKRHEEELKKMLKYPNSYNVLRVNKGKNKNKVKADKLAKEVNNEIKRILE